LDLYDLRCNRWKIGKKNKHMICPWYCIWSWIRFILIYSSINIKYLHVKLIKFYNFIFIIYFIGNSWFMSVIVIKILKISKITHINFWIILRTIINDNISNINLNIWILNVENLNSFTFKIYWFFKIKSFLDFCSFNWILHKFICNYV